MRRHRKSIGANRFKLGSNLGLTEKMEAIQSIISGNLSFEHLKPPCNHMAFIEDDVCNVNGLEMNLEEFEVWKAANVRECDTLLLFISQRSNDPLITEEELVAHCNEERKQTKATSKETIEPLKTAVNALKNDPIKEPNEIAQPIEETQLIAVPVKKGLMSEYGLTWGTKDKTYYLS